MKEAMFYEKLSRERVRCHLCSHHCQIEEGKRGICGVRENQEGTLYSLVYGMPVARDVDPIEKKPLFHFLPGTRAYSISTVGCNFTCLNCQNHYISQYPREHSGQIIAMGDDVSPSEIIEEAKQEGCQTIAYTYTEPTIFFEYALDIARLAHDEGLRNVFVSNGYMSPEAIDVIIPYLDGINIDLKGISDKFYRDIARGNLRPVLHSIERFFRAGVWLELTTLVIPGMNDSLETLRWIAEAIVGISDTIPVTRHAVYSSSLRFTRGVTIPQKMRVMASAPLMPPTIWKAFATRGRTDREMIRRVLSSSGPKGVREREMNFNPWLTQYTGMPL